MSRSDLLEIARPATDEYDAYYEGYVARVPQAPLLRTLESQRQRVGELYGNLDEERAGYRYAAGKWTIKEVLGHLLDSERVFAFRALWFARGQQTPLPDMDPDAFVAAGGFDTYPLARPADEYALVRESTLRFLGGLNQDQLTLKGTASGCDFTVRAIAFIVAGHELHHLDVLADRYELR